MPGNNMSFFALTTRGLETVSATEIRALPGVSVNAVSYRRIAGSCSISSETLETLLRLRTVDDAFITLATWSGIERTRATLAHLRALSRSLPLCAAAEVCARVRSIACPPTFSVTASFVGARSYNTDEIKSALAEGITQAQGWHYQADDRAAGLNVRIFIEQSVAAVGLRLGKAPLHERSYRRAHRPGALKPPVAAAMLALAEVSPGQRLLDPCCGTGTIVVEAALAGIAAQGGDSDPEAIRAAATNACAAGVNAMFTPMDVRALPLASGAVEAIVTNLPWDRQVAAGQDIGCFYRQAFAEMRRVLAPGGRLAVLTNQPSLALAANAGMRCVKQVEISLHGQRPTILVFAG